MMNEQILSEIASTDALDTRKLTVLRLRLETVSEFPQVLNLFVNEYETIQAIREMDNHRRDSYLDRGDVA